MTQTKCNTCGGDGETDSDEPLTREQLEAIAISGERQVSNLVKDTARTALAYLDRAEAAERERDALDEEYAEYRVEVFRFYDAHNRDVDDLLKKTDWIRAEWKAKRADALRASRHKETTDG